MMKQWLKIGFSVVLVIWLWRNVDWAAVGRIITGVSVSSLVTYVALQLLGNIISAAKWHYLARVQDFRFSLRDGFFAYLTGAFLNNFFPSTIGGDTYRVFWMSQSGRRFEAFTVVLFDRLSGLGVLILLTAGGLFFLPWERSHAHLILLIATSAVLGAACLILLSLFWFPAMYTQLLALIGRWPKLASLRVGMERLSPLMQSRPYRRALVWSGLFLGVGVGLSNFTLWQGLGGHLGAPAFFGGIFLATLIANIPISINNIGVKEWAYVFVFGLLGAAPELAVTAALLSRLLQMLISCLALPWYVRQRQSLEESGAVVAPS